MKDKKDFRSPHPDSSGEWLKKLKRFFLNDYFTGSFTIVAVLIALGVGIYLIRYSHEVSQHSRQMYRLERQIDFAQWEFNNKMDAYVRLNHFLLELVHTEETLKDKCQTTHTSSGYDQNDRRFMSRELLDSEVMRIQKLQLFNTEITTAAQQLIDLDKNTDDMCTKDAPPRGIWMEKYNHIHDLMDQSMQRDKNKLDQLKHQYE